MKDAVYSKKLERKAVSAIHGNGVFAIAPIAKGEFLFSKGGHRLPKSEMFSRTPLDCYWPVSDEYVLAPKTMYEVEHFVVNMNHSCNPNCGIRGEDEGIAIRDIEKGEEIFFDYAMLDNELNWFRCNCKQDGCRKIITSIDWKIEELQSRYDGQFAIYISEKIVAGEKYITHKDITSDIVALREQVFIKEQKIKKEDEFEGDEKKYIHSCLYKSGCLIAYARTLKNGNAAQISRVAVNRTMRKRGLGREIMFWAEAEARKFCCTEVVLNAQIQVKLFYERLGYKAIGEEFIEAGIPHIKMTKKLKL